MKHISLRAQKKERALASQKYSKNVSGGFTLIEVMVSLAIFATIVTMGMQAVLSAMQQHRSIQSVRTVMDNLNFVMEDMARNIRLATNIRCVLISDGMLNPDGSTSGGGVWYDSTTLDVVPQSCPVGTSEIVFNSLGHSSTDGKFVTYVISNPYSTTPNVIIKQKGADPISAQVVSPPEVIIDSSVSGFLVRGAETPSSPTPDFAQPTVVIRLAGSIKDGTVVTPFAIQTSVTLRSLDPN